MNVLFKILLAAVSTICCVAMLFSVYGILKRRMYRNQRYLGMNSEKVKYRQKKRRKKIEQVQEEMFEEFGRNESKMEQEETIVLTKELIKAARTTNGGLTKKQLAAIGVPWPPPKGWQESKIGTMITEEQLKRFQTIEYATKKKRKRKPHSTLL